MVSYREKQLLMVMKMLQDDTDELALQLAKAIDETQQKKALTGNIPWLPENISDFEDLVEMAEEKGYDMHIRASDILSEEELQDIEKRKEEIDRQFKAITRLHGADYAFLFAAIALQIARQAVQPRLDFENLLKNPKDRDYADKTAQEADASKTNETVNKNKQKASDEYGYRDNPDRDPKKQKQSPMIDNQEEKWRASLKRIADIHHVPYDANGEGLTGNHRYKTLGHDPWLGYLFGTANILTNTLTTNKMLTYHVVKGHTQGVGTPQNTALMFHYSVERFKEKGGKAVTTIALAKQAYHIRTDVKSKKGIPLPFLQLILDEKTIEKLCSMGIDYNAFQFVKGVATQALFAEMINFVVATSHRILVAKEEFDAYCTENNIEDEATLLASLKHKGFHDIIFGNESLNEVRTRKILLISNAVASSANIIYTGVTAGVSAYAGDAAGAYEALSKLDVGGILVTVKHLLSDGRVIAKIKNDFIQQAINSDFEAKLAAIEAKTV